MQNQDNFPLLSEIYETESDITINDAKKMIKSLQAELDHVKFANRILREENERLNTLYALRKSAE